MSTIAEKRFTVRGQTLAAKCWHDPAKPPLLALHGWLDNAATFDRLAPLLADYHIVALDFIGHGQSGWRPEGMRYHLADYIDDIYGVVQHLGWERFLLMGHSMGAALATVFAGTFSERIEKLLLIEGLGPMSGDEAETPAILRRAVEEFAGYQDSQRVIADKELAVKARQNGVGQISEEAARLLCGRGLTAVEGGYRWSTDKRVRLHSSLRMTEAQILGCIEAITADTLLVLAEQGLPVDNERYARRLAAHQHLQTVKLPGGHHLHLDQSPELVAKAIKGFLAPA